MSHCFSDKAVLVTGSNRNTGLEIAAHFSNAGATVFLNGKDPSDVQQAVSDLRNLGLNNILEAPGDVGSPEGVDSVFERILSHVKHLDVLVNNAAHLGVGYAFLDTPPEFFMDVLQVNLVGSFRISQRAARIMKEHGGGSIVHIGSNTSKRAIHHRSSYIASKGGLDALTLAMAIDLAPYRIRVNLVAPGYIHTDRWETLGESKRQRRKDNIPLGQEASAADVANAVLFLASDEASNITGTRLVVDGGCSAQHLPEDVDV